MNLPPLKVGDELILRTIRNGSEVPAVVTKTGRKWATAKMVEGWLSVRFDMTTGYEDGRGYQSMHRVLTADMDAAEKRVAAARDELHEAGVRLEPHLARTISVDTIEAIVAALRDAKETNA